MKKIMAEEIEAVITGCKTNNQVRAALKKADIQFEDKSWESDGKEMLSLWVGNCRIYKPHREKKFVVQEWEKVEFKYSGVPTFMPGGQDTFGEWF